MTNLQELAADFIKSQLPDFSEVVEFFEDSDYSSETLQKVYWLIVDANVEVSWDD